MSHTTDHRRRMWNATATRPGPVTSGFPATTPGAAAVITRTEDVGHCRHDLVQPGCKYTTSGVTAIRNISKVTGDSFDRVARVPEASPARDGLLTARPGSLRE